MFEIVASGKRVNGPGHACFIGDYLLGPQRNPDRLLCREGESLVPRICMKRLSPAQYTGQGLNSHPGDVIVRLLSCERLAAGLSVEPQLTRFRVFGFELLFHYPGPDAARGPELGYLLQEIVPASEEEGELRGEPANLHPPSQGRSHVLDGVGEAEAQLLA